GGSMSVQSGGTFDYAGAWTLSRQYGAPDPLSIMVSGANSRLLTGGLFTADGASITVTASGGGSLRPQSLLVIGNSGVGASVSIDGLGSSLSTGVATVGGSTLTG